MSRAAAASPPVWHQTTPHTLRMWISRRERGAGRHGREGEEAVELARGGGEELAVRGEHLRAAARPARTSGRRSPCSTSWRRNSNAVTTPKLPPPPRSAQNRSGCSSLLAWTSSPLASTTSAPTQVVDRQAVLAGQVAESAAEREPADAGRRDDAARGREPVLVGGAVDLAPRAAAADADGPRARVDVDPADRGEVDHEAVVDVPSPAPLCPPPRTATGRSRCRAYAMQAGDVVGARGLRDQRRPAVDHAVVDAARLS